MLMTSKSNKAKPKFKKKRKKKSKIYFGTPVQNAIIRYNNHDNPVIKNSVAEYFRPHTESAHSTYYVAPDAIELQPAAVILVSHLHSELTPEAYQSIIDSAWQILENNGVLVIREHCDSIQQQQVLENMISSLGDIHYYSGIVASAIHQEVEISQYSLAVEQDLRQEKTNKDNLFRVIKKLSSS